jgi:hypothetical protein
MVLTMLAVRCHADGSFVSLLRRDGIPVLKAEGYFFLYSFAAFVMFRMILRIKPIKDILKTCFQFSVMTSPLNWLMLLFFPLL